MYPSRSETNSVLSNKPLKDITSELDNIPGVIVRGERRRRNILEPVSIDKEIWQQARHLGYHVNDVLYTAADFLRSDPSNGGLFNLTPQQYQQRVYPFRDLPQKIIYFGVDCVLSEGNLYLIEMNTQPSVLGAYDIVNSQALGQSDSNSRMSPFIRESLDDLYGKADTAVISHPSNPFFEYHRAFAEQCGYIHAALQDLVYTKGSDHVLADGKPVKRIVKQFNTVRLLDPEVTSPEVLDAIVKGKLDIVNGPLSPLLGNKVFLYSLASFAPELSTYLPEMHLLSDSHVADFSDLENFWLKGDTISGSEMTFNLGENGKGWRGQFLTALVQQDFSLASTILERQHPSRTVAYFADLVKQSMYDPCNTWLLQRNHTPSTIQSEYHPNLHTLLRFFYVSRGKNREPKTFMTMYASESRRVSAAGYTIPVRGQM